MAIDKRVLQVCRKCAMTHIGDIEAALVSVKRKLKIPGLPAWIAGLVDNALREQIHFFRHVSNRKLRKANGGYGPPGKVGTSSSLNEVAETVWQQSVFNHTIAGWRFGEISKTDLLAFADVEDEKADGCRFNAMLCQKAASLCAKKRGETVEECLTEKQVKGLFRAIAKELAKELGRDAA